MTFFEWDEQKRISNLRKHEVDFVKASRIFDNYTLEYEDSRYDYSEERYIAIGQVDSEVLFVVYTVRGDAIRLISARKATKNERRNYYQSNPRRD